MFESIRRPLSWSSDVDLAAITDETRRRCLEVLVATSTPVPVAVLATRVAAAEHGESPIAVTDEAQRRHQIELVHVHLPLLDDEGYLEWDRDDDTVRPSDHPAVRDPSFQRLLRIGDSDWNAVVTALDDGRRRLALWILADAAEESLEWRDLARRVLARESDESPEEISQKAVDEIAVTFHHVHLPTLAEADLIERHDDGIEYLGHPALDAAWLAADRSEATGSNAGATGQVL